MKTKFLSFFMVLIFSCQNNGNEIQGNWTIESQEYISLKTNERKIISPPDFKLISITESTIFLDGNEGVFSLKNDSLKFSDGHKILTFKVITSENMMALISSSYLDEGITTFYFKRAKTE